MINNNSKIISVLYIHHCADFGGSSRSLLETINAFPEKSVQPVLISPRGSTADYYSKFNIPTIKVWGISIFDNSEYSYYRSLRWLILVREFLYLPSTIYSIFKAKKVFQNINIIHVNEVLPILSIILAKKLFKKPIVLHVRSVQRKDLDNFRSKFINWVLKKYVDSIVAIDETVRLSLPQDLNVSVIHNGFDAFSKITTLSDKPKSTLKSSKIVIGIVGNYLYVKGVIDFIKAAKICIEKELDIEFWMIGDKGEQKKSMLKKYFKYSQDAREEMVDFINDNKLENKIKLIPFTTNITSYYQQIDILCFPSHFNAPGRPIFEAGVFKIPSIVAVEQPTSDTIIDHQSGICIPPQNIEKLAEAMQFFYDNPKEIVRMGQGAYNLSQQNFDIKKNASKLLNIYLSLLDSTKDKS